jgi:hypothetical protein
MWLLRQQCRFARISQCRDEGELAAQVQSFIQFPDQVKTGRQVWARWWDVELGLQERASHLSALIIA